MAWARRMSQWSAYYFSLLKKKKLRESLLLMNSIKAKLQRKRFSAKIIQHGAQLKTARWPKVEGSSWFQKPRSRIPKAEPLSLFNPACIFFFSPIDFFAFFPHFIFGPPPRSSPEKLLVSPPPPTSWDLQKSLFNSSLDNRVKLSSSPAWSEANSGGGGRVHRRPPSGSRFTFLPRLRSGAVEAFEYKNECVYFKSFLPHYNQGKWKEIGLFLQHLMPTDPPHSNFRDRLLLVLLLNLFALPHPLIIFLGMRDWQTGVLTVAPATLKWRLWN